jgi:hypothetical protein
MAGQGERRREVKEGEGWEEAGRRGRVLSRQPWIKRWRS